MILIGIGNRAKQGKSLFCETIIDHCSRSGIKAREYSISDLVMADCIARGLLPDVPRTRLDSEQVKVLVKVGNERRAEEENFWIDKIRDMISGEMPDVALLPNVRFPSEALFVKSLGGFNVRVRLYNANGTRFISPDRNPNDPTETSLDFWKWDFEIRNMAKKPYWLRRQATALLDYLWDGGE